MAKKILLLAFILVAAVSFSTAQKPDYASLGMEAAGDMPSG